MREEMKKSFEQAEGCKADLTGITRGTLSTPPDGGSVRVRAEENGEVGEGWGEVSQVKSNKVCRTQENRFVWHGLHLPRHSLTTYVYFSLFLSLLLSLLLSLFFSLICSLNKKKRRELQDNEELFNNIYSLNTLLLT